MIYGESFLVFVIFVGVALASALRSIWEDRVSCEILWIWPVLFAVCAFLSGAVLSWPGFFMAIVGASVLGAVSFGIRVWFRFRLGFEALGLADVIVLAGIGGSLGPLVGSVVMAAGAIAGIVAMVVGGFGSRPGTEAGVDTERNVLPLLPFLLGSWILGQAAVLVMALSGFPVEDLMLRFALMV